MLNRIEAWETIPIREVDEGIVGGPSQADATRVLQDRIDGRVSAGDRRDHSATCIGDENRPWQRLGPRQRRPRRAAGARLAQKRYPFSVDRPGGQRVA